MEEQKQNIGKRMANFHNKYYKHLLLIPLAIFLLSFAYMFFFYSVNHDFIYKDVTLAGGTSVTIYGDIDSSKLKQQLSSQLNDINTREIYDLGTKERIAVVIETKSDGDVTKKALENYLGYKLTSENSSFEFTGAVLSQSFYQQLLMAIFFAFLFMSAVVFIIFRKTIIPSVAVILSAFADIFMTLTIVNILGIKMSSAGLVAFLMLIGYSVDTDILLTNRVLRSNDDSSLNQKIFKSFKTGITMTLTSLFAVVVSLVISFFYSSTVLTQIFTILTIGLFFDILNTWVTNVSIIKWYVIRK
ncbi:MAG: protein translocase subunit SecF [Nanoarchaeota archaeon]